MGQSSPSDVERRAPKASHRPPIDDQRQSAPERTLFGGGGDGHSQLRWLQRKGGGEPCTAGGLSHQWPQLRDRNYAQRVGVLKRSGGGGGTLCMGAWPAGRREQEDEAREPSAVMQHELDRPRALRGWGAPWHSEGTMARVVGGRAGHAVVRRSPCSWRGLGRTEGRPYQ